MATRREIEIQALRRHLLEKDLSARDVETFYRLYKTLAIVYPNGFLFEEKGVPDYFTKSVILDCYLYELSCVRQLKRYQYLVDYGLLENAFKDSYSLTSFLVKVNYARELEYSHPFLFKQCEKIIHSDYQRKSRLKKRISRIQIKGHAYFVTLTFNDDFLQNTSSKYRREFVQGFLKSISNDYVANIDFGEKKGREHYHAVIYCPKLENEDFSLISYKGYCNFDTCVFDDYKRAGSFFIQRLGISDKDVDKVAKYTAKLANHAVKNTTKRNALIYSR